MHPSGHLHIWFHLYLHLQVRHVIFLFCQFVNHIEVTRLPVYYPSQQEKDDPKLYANNVRKLMAREVCDSIVLNYVFCKCWRAYTVRTVYCLG